MKKLTDFPDAHLRIFKRPLVPLPDAIDDVQHITPAHVVDAWDEEKQWYDYASNRCSAPPGDSCGHYTQVVWARSEELGCAMMICQNKAQLWVCNYDPPGNYIGQKPF